MVRSCTGKHTFTKATVVAALGGLVGAVLVLDFLWASVSSSSSSSSSTYSYTIWANHRSRLVVISNLTDPSQNKRADVKEKKQRVPEGLLNYTFADIVAPRLEWEEMAPAPVPRLDGSSVQIKNLLYVFSGYGTIDYVHSHVDVYNFTDKTWGGRFDTPKEMAHSHLGITTDGRYVYVISGQYGPQCRGPTARAFVLDTQTKKWQSFPPLPVPRYAPATQIWKGRLHVIGGSKENRHTPGKDHWSIAVKNGKALEKKWRTEVSIPRGGPHRACVAVENQLYVIGGQEGDFMPKPGSPIFKCSRRHEVVYGDVYMLDEKMKWKELPPMPKPDSHIECSWVLVNNSIIIVGGTTEKHPVTKRMILVGELFRFDLRSHKWYSDWKASLPCENYSGRFLGMDGCILRLDSGTEDPIIPNQGRSLEICGEPS
ncbi:hypothetical protein HYC85_002889 [Camellia sinensis]|uniref:Kelch repeat-containing protein n=1 Tax=Camellia sinensis TaxID=4442 RepID=A0A7J7I9L5_CAMSI|nr:hypothetical protein HYC85_002889 [Camellia sinensis]